MHMRLNRFGIFPLFKDSYRRYSSELTAESLYVYTAAAHSFELCIGQRRNRNSASVREIYIYILLFVLSTVRVNPDFFRLLVRSTFV